MSKCWLVKSEPLTFSFDDLRKSPRGTTSWEGVRNYQARNFMRDDMKRGDRVLFYHSNCDPTGVVGVAEVSKEAAADPTAWDPKSRYHDPKSTLDNSVWVTVDLTFKEAFKRMVTLQELKSVPELCAMKVVQRGQRLSVQPVTPKEFDRVCAMGMAP